MFFYVFVVFYTHSLVLNYNITYHQPNILPFPCLYGMFCYVFVVFYTQSLVLMLQYHISTTKHSTVPVFIRCVLLCVHCILPTITSTDATISHITNQTLYVPVFIRYDFVCACCILHTITCTNVTISHLNNQKVCCSRAYTVYHFVFVVFCTQSLVLMLQDHISTIKHYSVPVFIRYVLLCICCILHTPTCTNVTISHINNQTFYRSLVYTVCYVMCSLYFTHNH